MQQPVSLTHKLLISSPHANTTDLGGELVVYISEHNALGAKGLIINKPSGYTLTDLLEKLDIPLGEGEFSHKPILIGGLGQKEKGAILALFNNELIVSTAKEVLEDLASGLCQPDEYLIALGSMEWKAGALDNEISQNAWLISPVNHCILFDTPFNLRWKKAGELLGINLNLLSPGVHCA